MVETLNARSYETETRTHCKNTIASSTIAVHFQVTMSPVLDSLNRERRLHEPREHRVQTKYDLGNTGIS